jgi:hypothetical protein
LKLQLSYELSNEEEEHHIDSQKLAEIDPGGIEEQAVANEHSGRRNEPANLLRSKGVMQARLKASVALHLKVGGQSENDESSNR